MPGSGAGSQLPGIGGPSSLPRFPPELSAQLNTLTRTFFDPNYLGPSDLIPDAQTSLQAQNNARAMAEAFSGLQQRQAREQAAGRGIGAQSMATNELVDRLGLLGRALGESGAREAEQNMWERQRFGYETAARQRMDLLNALMEKYRTDVGASQQQQSLLLGLIPALLGSL